MKRDHVNYFVVGCMVLTLTAAFFAVLYKLTSQSGPTEIFVVHYDNVTGIKYGTGVFFQGYPVGQVERIVPDRSTGQMRYRLELAVRRGWSIPKDSVARIESSGLISAVYINIEEGEAKEFLAPGEELHGRNHVDIVSTLGDVAADIHDLSENGLKPVLKNFNKRLDEIGVQIEGLDIKGLMAKLDHSVAQLEHTLRDENVKHVDRIVANADDATQHVNKLAIDLGETRTKANALLAELHGLVNANREGVTQSITHIKAAATDLEKTVHAVSTNINDIMYHLNDGSRNMHEFTRQIRENPSVLLHGTQPGTLGGKARP
jgi:phospholipid/cholesterol/gamma-HCH transport system substrate-binding protein